LAEQTTVNR